MCFICKFTCSDNLYLVGVHIFYIFLSYFSITILIVNLDIHIKHASWHILDTMPLGQTAAPQAMRPEFIPTAYTGFLEHILL